MEALQPGLADRIIRRAEREQQHRHDVVDAQISEFKIHGSHTREMDKEDRRFRHRGQWIGAGIMLAVVGAGCFLGWLGNPTAAATIIVTGVLAVGGIYVFDSKNITAATEQRSEPEETGLERRRRS